MMGTLQPSPNDASTEDPSAQPWPSSNPNTTVSDRPDDNDDLYSHSIPAAETPQDNVQPHNNSANVNTTPSLSAPATTVQDTSLDPTAQIAVTSPANYASPPYHQQPQQPSVVASPSNSQSAALSSHTNQSPYNQPSNIQQPQFQQRASGSRTSAASDPASVAKIFVGGLSWETDEDSLRRYFESIGTVADCVIMRDRHTGHPRGFGFVTFADEEAAAAASTRRHELDGRQVEAKRAVPRSEGTVAVGASGGSTAGMVAGAVASSVSGAVTTGAAGGGLSGAAVIGGAPIGGAAGGLGVSGLMSAGLQGSATFGRQSSQLPRYASSESGGLGGGGAPRHHSTRCKGFVGGLPSGCGEEEFRAYFSRFGEVVEAQVMIDYNTGNSRGFGFVTFANEATVSAVVGPGKSNTDHEIMGKCVEVKRAEPKGPPSERRNSHRSDNFSAGTGNVGSLGTGSGGGGLRGPAGGNDGGLVTNAGSNGAGTNAAAAAAAAYYSNYPASLAEQYGAYYNSPQWQQYFAAIGYNFNAYPQGFNPYQQYLQAFMSNANATSGGTGGGSGAASGGVGVAGTVGGGSGVGGSGGVGGVISSPGMAVNGAVGVSGVGSGSGDGSTVGYDSLQGAGVASGNAASAGGVRYGAVTGGGGDVGGNNQNGHGSNGGGAGGGPRRSSRRDDRYHPYR